HQAQQEHAAAVATMKQLTAQPSGRAVHPYAPIQTPSNVPKAIYYEREAYELGREEAFTKEWARASYQHGGLVPGVGPRPIIAHGGERIVPGHGGPEIAA